MALTIDELNIQIEAECTKATTALDVLIEKLKTVQDRLNGLSSAGKNAGKGLQETAKGATKAETATNKYSNTTNKASKSTKSFTDKLAQQISKTRTLYGAFKSAANIMGSWFKESNDYIETLNLFNVTMGEGADAAYQYAENVQKLVGIDIKEWMQYQGVFKNLASGFGVTSDAANVMSQNLTQLSYDMASFFNTDVETAFDKLSSAMSGQVKGLREFGIDTTVASLQEYALAKGIDKSVRSMTQAEKTLLRYNYIMEKSTTIQGDMARTLVTPANSMRILNAQLTQMKRALGNIISVLVAKFIPYVQAMVEVITDAANSLANFFGFELPKIDYSGLGGLSGELEDSEESANGIADAAKKIKKQLMGFDELNILSNPETDSGTASVGGGGVLGGMQPLEYDFLKGLDTKKIEDIKETVKEIAKWAGVAAAGFAGWKVSGSILGLGSAFSGFITSLGSGEGIGTAAATLASKFKKAFGVALMSAGAALDIEVAIESWTDGVSWDGLVEQLEAAGLLHLGGFLVGGPTGMAIGAMIDGVLSLIPSVKSAVADGNKEWSNTLSIVKGIATLFGGLSVLTGSWIPIAIGGVITIISLIAIYFDDIVAWFKSLPGIIGGFFSDLWTDIKNIWSSVANWFDKNVITPVVNFFKGLWESVAGFFSSLWEGIKNIWNTVATWFDENVIQPIVDFFAPIVEWISTFFYGCWLIIQAVWITVSTWFDENVIQPIVNFFEGLWESVSEFFVSLWEDIKSVWNTVATWFDENVITPVVDFFKGLWESVAGFFSSLWEDIKNIWNKVATWFDKNVITPVVNFFKGVWDKVSGFFVNLWNGIKNIWNKVATWFKENVIDPVKNAWDKACSKISEFFTNLWSGIKKGVVDAMNAVIGGIESAINWVIRGINKLIGGFNSVVEWAADVVGADWGGLSKITEVSLKRISYFESGGFPEMGEMFIAREAGPELVGSIGRKTAVANNDQIVSGIENGVYRAVMAANSTNKGGSQTIHVITEIDGDKVGEKVIKYHNGKVIQTGVSPLLV